jgi:acyl-coenzyme A thioesterase PaaI-like protein
VPEEQDPDKAAAQRLADAMRRIIARMVVVRPPADQVERAAEAANRFADSLDDLPERSKSWEVSEAGLQPRDFVNHSPLSGAANPIAPPLSMWIVDDGDGDYHMEGTVTFGAAYEGPPGHCHGGFVAAMFDELLGFVQLAPGFTAYLHVDYRRPTPLNRELELRGWIESVEGRKRMIRGTCHLDGTLLSEAHGLFIAPHPDRDYLGIFGQPAGGTS